MANLDTSPNGGGSAAAQSASDLSGQARAAGEEIKAKVSDLTGEVSRVAKDQAGEIGNAAKEIVSDATTKVKAAVDEQKQAGAEYLGSFANAVRRASGEFEADTPQTARYIRQAADQIESVAESFRQKDLRQLVDDVKDVARRQPTLFFGGAVILGFAAVRFLKSSSSSFSTSDTRSYSGDRGRSNQVASQAG